MRISAACVHRLAEEEILHRISNRRTRYSRDRFAAAFGCSPKVVASLWNRLEKKNLLPDDALCKHLLWALFFLKLYIVEKAAAPLCGAAEKTFSKWIWIILDALAELDIVSQFILLVLSVRRIDPANANPSNPSI